MDTNIDERLRQRLKLNYGNGDFFEISLIFHTIWVNTEILVNPKTLPANKAGISLLA